MSEAFKTSFFSPKLISLANEISKVTGNQFGDKQYSMIESRLKKRSLDLGLPSLELYFDHFERNKSVEIEVLTSLLTTHHTYFFREFTHFEYLEEKILPQLKQIASQRADKKMKIWSAACSRGQEVYSLGMFLDYWLKKNAPDLTFEILGSDIDAESVKFAQNGVYTRKETKEIPNAYLGDHWAKGTGEIAEFVKVKNALRNKSRWMTLNFFSMPASFNEKFDIIFCRNVFIYFNHQQIKEVTKKLLSHLNEAGALFLGVSETLNGLELPVESIGPSIYGFKKNAPHALKPTPVSHTASNKVTRSTSPAVVPQVAHKDILRVLCVDDSPSIITILKNILTAKDGFEIVGVASNGKEAAEKLAQLNPDVMTLDIHMPVQNGVEYLASNFKSSHPPVVMVSSVSREDSAIALNALKLGASDYVEKPALNNFQEVGEQLRRKLRSAWRTQEHLKQSHVTKVDDQFKTQLKILHPERGIRVVLGQMAELPRIKKSLQELKPGGPATVVLLEFSNDALADISKNLLGTFEHINAWKPLKVSNLYYGDLSKLAPGALNHISNYFASFLVFGELSEKNTDFIQKLREKQVLIEDLGPKGNEKNPLKKMATDTMPVTGFVYTSDEYFSRKT